MLAMQLDQALTPLRPRDVPVPVPAAGQVLVRVCACAVCRTDLHVVDGELTQPKLPLTPGHEIIGRVARLGAGVERFAEGQRVGIPWLGWTCGECAYCRGGRENLCAAALFTGYQIDGGYAEYALADARYCFGIPEGYSDAEAAPLMCAGLIGYRTLRMAGEARRIGIYGFGAAAHIAAQVARAEGREIFAFTRPGDTAAQEFAQRITGDWAGGSDEAPPEPLEAALIFAPVGALVPAALRAVAPGGAVVCGGIHMSDIPAFPYDILWMERSVRSVANLTRADGDAFLAFAGRHRIAVETTPYPLAEANAALAALRSGALTGAAVLLPPGQA
jgi:alcohol dehydrogenase, propanol-preferring